MELLLICKRNTDEKTVEASLVEGCIELDHGNDKLLMNAGDNGDFR